MANRLLQFSRRFGTNKSLLGNNLVEPLQVGEESVHEVKIRKLEVLAYYILFPVAVVHGAWVLFFHEEKPRPEFKKYPYLRIRKSIYPWRDGVKTLFHSHNNALPDGYEDEM